MHTPEIERWPSDAEEIRAEDDERRAGDDVAASPGEPAPAPPGAPPVIPLPPHVIVRTAASADAGASWDAPAVGAPPPPAPAALPSAPPAPATLPGGPALAPPVGLRVDTALRPPIPPPSRPVGPGASPGLGFTGTAVSALRSPVPGGVEPARRAPLGAVVAVVLLVVLAGAGAGWWYVSSRQPEPRSVAISLAVGEAAQVFRADARLRWASSGAPLHWEAHTDFEGILTLKASPADHGGAKVRGILDLSRLSVNGRPFTEPPTIRAKMQFSGDGTVVRGGVFRLPLPSPPIQLLLTGLGPDLPTHAIRPGDAWTDRQEVRVGKERLLMTSRSEFLRYEQMSGVEVAVIHGTRSFEMKDPGPRKRGHARVEQTAWFDPGSGAVLKMSATIWIEYSGPDGGYTAGDRLQLTAV